MNEMYNASISYHNLGVLLILLIIIINYTAQDRSKNLEKYKKFTRVFMPIGMTMFGVIVFTGIVMMAAKHLDFTLQNITMIGFSIAFIILENMRSLKLNAISKDNNSQFLKYKKYGAIIFQIELSIISVISIWMWI